MLLDASSVSCATTKDNNIYLTYVKRKVIFYTSLGEAVKLSSNNDEVVGWYFGFRLDPLMKRSGFFWGYP